MSAQAGAQVLGSVVEEEEVSRVVPDEPVEEDDPEVPLSTTEEDELELPTEPVEELELPLIPLCANHSGE